MTSHEGLVQLAQAADSGPIAVAGQDVERAASLLAGENSFLVSFLVGAVVILFLARKQSWSSLTRQRAKPSISPRC